MGDFAAALSGSLMNQTGKTPRTPEKAAAVPAAEARRPASS
jgi:hypothetical protein